jgi:ribosomal protein L14
MIKAQTILLVADNSGAVYGKCIRVMQSATRLGAKGGDIVYLVIKRVFIKRNLKKSKRIIKGQICRAVVLRTIKITKR